MVWAGWVVTHLNVFCWAQGIFHEYYTTVMAPAIAALAALGLTALWRAWFHGDGWRGFLLPLALIGTAAWQAFIVARHYPDARRWLLPTVLTGVGVAAVGMFALRAFVRYRGVTVCAKLAAGLGLVVLLVGPASWSLAVLVRPGNAVMPAATEPVLISDRANRERPGRPPFGGPMGRDSRLVDFLRANRRDERFLVAASSVMPVAPVIITTGEPAIALGGFMGADPAVTHDEFAHMVAEGQVRFVLVGGGPGGPGRPPGPGPGGAPPPPGRQTTAEIMAWVQEHGKEVSPRLWQPDEPADGLPDRGPGNRGGRGGPGGRAERLYDCRPELGLVGPNAR
jgi:4-amino-4-deoxy-L-arabinose transferase-like glycosyltransferase